MPPCNGDCNQGRECICECKKETNMTKQHKWHKEIKAWADDDQCIEVCKEGIWYSTDYPEWHQDNEYRIKPQPKEPKYLYVWQELNYGKAYITANVSASNVPAGYAYLGKI